jgi:glycosyltransferase involved in cell wall biosynthesis
MELPNQLAWIVNNNCTYHTDSVVDDYRRTPVGAARVKSQPGKSRALNHAIDAANREYILWTDDDVVVDLG